LGIICLGWLWTTILLISTSWIARITGMSHQRLVNNGILMCSWAHKYHQWKESNCCYGNQANAENKPNLQQLSISYIVLRKWDFWTLPLQILTLF
jgi:hypothetical protein